MWDTVRFKYGRIDYSVTRQVDARSGYFNDDVHTLYEILFIYRGEGKFLIEDTEYEFAENTLFLIPPGKYHFMCQPPKKHYDRCVLYFPLSLLPAPLDKKISLQYKVDERVRELFVKLEGYGEKYTGEAFYSLICSFITELLITVVYDETETATNTAVPNLVKNTMEYINSNLDKDLSAQSIADAMFVSRTHLCHIFSETMKTGLMRYVTIKKMYKARSMLKKGISSNAVCEALGYKSYPTFWRNYKAQFNKPPSDES